MATRFDIQGADLSKFDWERERAVEAKLGEDGCPPGLGVVRGDGAIFHMTPREGGYSGYLHYLVLDPPPPPSGRGMLAKFKSLIAAPPVLAFRRAHDPTLRSAIAAFLDNRDSSVVSLLGATP